MQPPRPLPTDTSTELTLGFEQQRRTRRQLTWIRWLSLLDLLLLLALLTASWLGAREWVSLLGPLHGGQFLLLLTVAGVGAVDRHWHWGFPLAILLTGGPPGAFWGEWRLRRRLDAELQELSAQAAAK